MEVETARSVTEVFMHGFSAGMAFAAVLVGVVGYFRARRDP